MKRNDWIIIAVIVVLALSIYLWNRLSVGAVQSNALFVEVRLNGELYEQVSLQEQKEITVESEWGKNTVYVDKGVVKMTYADCPDEVCLKTGEIHQIGQNIVCLPHKLSVTIVGNTEDGVDAIIQ